MTQQMEVVTKNGLRVTKRDVHLVDESGTMMKLTLWRDQALKINPQMFSGKVVHGKRLIVKKTENGFISLTMNNHSYFIPISGMENEQVDKLWSWYTNERSSVTIVEQSFQPIAVPKPLHDVQTVEGLFASKATILSIDLDNTFYKGCPECQKSGCEKTLEQFSWIVKLQVNLGDGDTSLHAVVFSSVGERLIEMDGNALANMKQSDIFEHDKLIERLVGMEREWFIRTKKSSFNNKLEHVITGLRVIKTEFIARDNVEAEESPSYSGCLGEIRIQPRCMEFNALYMFSQKKRMTISNDSNRHVAIRIMFSNPHRSFAEDETEIIRPLDNLHTFINCASFGFNQNVIEKHQIIIQWTNVSRGVKEFSHHD
ncbi:hypothetical protein L5515_005011 [Caenorhabditis briggsae]|uniref:Major sperm protein n=1 Tax=Caenorhabditis briggsae TaxID=6238 RepID=A0AAE9ERJ0_CAEBR|nr:hypothetical protein L5515_005011 [Caenorhabditis briggsae]